MTQDEFDVLDELYFLQTFEALEGSVAFSGIALATILRKMIQKGWVRIYLSPDDEILFNPETFGRDYMKYYYLASKAGLLAHNSTDE